MSESKKGISSDHKGQIMEAELFKQVLQGSAVATLIVVVLILVGALVKITKIRRRK